MIEEEWAKAFTLSASDKSILTPIIRACYDRIPIGKANRGDNAYRCAQPHVSIIGNITPDDLRQSLTGRHAVSIANGFVNRFLLVATRRTKYLPRGGKWVSHADKFIPAIREALGRARSRTLMALDDAAGTVWDALYPELEARPEGVAGAATARASDMVMKLAMVYALADGDDAIRTPHLRAGLAVWRYCEATAFALFGGGATNALGTLAPEPDPLWLRLLNAIISNPGILRSELTRTHQRHGNADDIGAALEGLRVKGLAFPKEVHGKGRVAEHWFPASGGGDGEKVNNNTETTPAGVTPNPFAGLVVGDAVEGSKEGGSTHTSLLPSTAYQTTVDGRTPTHTSLLPSTPAGVPRPVTDVWRCDVVSLHRTPEYEWHYHVNDAPDPPTPITREWVKDHVILTPTPTGGFTVTNRVSPDVIEWLERNRDVGLELAKEYAEQVAWFDGVGGRPEIASAHPPTLPFTL